MKEGMLQLLNPTPSWLLHQPLLGQSITARGSLEQFQLEQAVLCFEPSHPTVCPGLHRAEARHGRDGDLQSAQTQPYITWENEPTVL